MPISVATSPSATHLLEGLAIALTPGLGPTPGAKTSRLRNIPARVSLHDALLSKIVMCFCPWQWHKQEFLGPNTWIKQGAELVATWKRERISLQQYDLCWSGLPAMNPAAHLRHLYFQTKGFHPTKSGSWACSRPTKQRTWMKSLSNWRQKCRLRKFWRRRSLNWSWRGK